MGTWPVRADRVAPEGQAPRATFLALALVLAAGVGLRLAYCDVVGLWWDEFVTLGRARLPLLQLLPSLAFEGPSDVSLDSSPPLLHLLVHAALLFGRSDVWVKLPSVVAGCCTLPVVYLAGRELFSRTAGLASAALAAFSLFHIHYSREARPYALYLLSALLGLLFLARALRTGRRRDWLGFAAASAIMFYSSYLASATFFAEGLFVLGRIVWLFRRDRLATRRLLLAAGLTAAAVILVYAPWTPAHRFQVLTIYSEKAAAPFDLAMILSVFKEFSAFYYQGGPVYPAALAGLALAGLAWHLSLGRCAAVALVALWGIAAVVMAALLPTDIHVSVRYLVNLFFLYIFLAAGGIEAVLAALGRACPPRLLLPAASLLVVALAAAASLPTFVSLPYYYKRETPSVKSVMSYLALAKANRDTLLFYRNRHLKIMSQWYLGDAYGYGDDWTDRRYRRFYFLGPADEERVELLAGLVPVRPTFLADILAGGAVNRSPLCFDDSAFRQEFTDLSFYRDVFFAENLAPDLRFKTLALFDCAKPGRAVYAFALPPGAKAAGARLAATFVLRAGPAGRLPEGCIGVFAGADPAALSPLATVTAADFPPTGGKLEKCCDIPGTALQSGTLYLAFAVAAGNVDGFLEIKDFTVTPEDLSPPPDIPPAWRRYAAHVAVNAPVVPFVPGQTANGGLIGFAGRPEPALHLGGPAEKAAYLDGHPGDAPVATLRDADGTVAVEYFDPGLRRPFVTVDSTAAVVDFGLSGPVRGMEFEGEFSGQGLTIGPANLAVPVAGPPGGRLYANTDGRGLFFFQPEFTQPFEALKAEAFLMHGLVKRQPEPCLTCSGDQPCFLTYALTATVPITGFRLAWYPRVLTDAAGQNRIEAAYSTDGVRYLSLGELVSQGDFFWYGGAMRKVANVGLPRPTDRLYIRFTLSGGGAELWSAPETPLTLEADLDVTGMAFPTLPPGPVTARAEGGTVNVLFSPAPLPLGRELRERY